MCETKITDDIRNWMENKACYDEIDHGVIWRNYIPWFGKRDEIEPLLNNIDKEYSKICERMATSKSEFKVSYKVTNNGILLSEEDQERILDTVFQLKADNSDLRELLAMYVAFGMAAARDCTFQNAYRDGMGKKLNETKMRERAFQMGIDIKHI